MEMNSWIKHGFSKVRMKSAVASTNDVLPVSAVTTIVYEKPGLPGPPDKSKLLSS